MMHENNFSIENVGIIIVVISIFIVMWICAEDIKD